MLVKRLLVLLGEVRKATLTVVKYGYEDTDHIVDIPFGEAEVGYSMDILSKRALKEGICINVMSNKMRVNIRRQL